MTDNQNRLLSEKQPLEVVSSIRSQLAYYDFLLPGDYVPDPPLVKRWFRWRPAFEVTQDMLVWAGTLARARSLMDLKGVEDALAAAARDGGDVQQAPAESPQSGPKGIAQKEFPNE